MAILMENDWTVLMHNTLNFRGHSWFFDYGQIHDAWKDLRVTDNKGVALNFYDGDETFAFNFFYFNGWQLDQYIGSPSVSIFILKKRVSQ